MAFGSRAELRCGLLHSGMLLSALLLSGVLGCGGGPDAPADEPPTVVPRVAPAPAGDPWQTLGEWHLFTDAVQQAPNERVVPYDVIAPLYSDYTFKRRFVFIPEGTAIEYDPTAVWQLPVGTILVKTFSYLTDMRDPSLGERLLETRLLLHEPTGWTGHTYVWDEAQTEAVRKVAGDIIPSSWIHTDGETRQNDYAVPNTNECHDCHGEDETLDSLGLRTRQLQRDNSYASGPTNQIDQLDSLGWFTATPPSEREQLVDPLGTAPLLNRVRSYLDANCGSCHSSGSAASQSALLLAYPETAPDQSDGNWGVCKVPTSAGGATCGNTFDIVPGDPDASIMICRLDSADPTVRMPPLASRIPHDEGVALIREWILSLPGSCE